MSNSFYNHGSFPSTGSAATSASMRAELDLVTAGFDKMPTLSGNADYFVVVNNTGTGLTATNTLPGFTATDTTFFVQDNGDNTKKFRFEAGSITSGVTRVYTMPDADATLVGRATTDTLTNKTLTAPVIASIVNTGTLTLPTSTDTLVGRATTDTLTNKTIQGGSITALTALGIRSTGTGAFDLTLANTENLTVGRTLTIKVNDAARTIDLSGALTIAAAFTTSGAFALTLTSTGATNVTLPTTGTLATLAGTESLSNKTFVAPVLGTPASGTATNLTGLPLTTGVTGTLPVANGGTGLTAGTSGGVLAYTATGVLASSAALTQYGVVYGGGAGAVPVATAAGTTGQILQATTGGAPVWGSTYAGTVTSVAQSFTGGLISVAGSPVTTSGTLALTVAGTSGGIPYFSSASTWATSAALAANALVLGGGAGAAPATTTTGTGVVTALGVNTGTAGAFVVNGGALGSPSSAGTIPAFTLGGTVAGGGNQLNNVVIGTTTPLAGAFTTLSATGAITSTLTSGNIFSNSSGGANGLYTRLINTGADCVIGIESSAGGYVMTGTSPYSTVIAFKSGKKLEIGATAPVVQISDLGLAVTGTLSATGTITPSIDIQFGAGGTSFYNYQILRHTNNILYIQGGTSGIQLNRDSSRLDTIDIGSTANQIDVQTNGVTRTRTTNSGLAVTGTLSATGANGGVYATPDFEGAGSHAIYSKNGANYNAFNYEGASHNWWIGTTSTTQAMTLNASGNLGIGTTAPGDKITSIIAGSNAAATDYILSGGSATYQMLGIGEYTAGNAIVIANKYSGGGNITFRTGSATPAEVMRIDSSGNLGLGVTPSAWGSGSKALQINSNLSLWSQSSTNNYIYANAYFDGTTDKYVSTAEAARIRFAGAVTIFNYAASGSANANIAWLESFRTDASGNLLVGTTTTGGWQGNARGEFYATGSGGFSATGGVALSVYQSGSSVVAQNIRVNATNSALIQFQYNGATTVGSIKTDGTNIALDKVSGITFPATQSASSDANTLDDYEEGTWTPTFTNCGSTTLSFAKYTKIGRVINYQMSFTSTSLTANSSRWTTAFSSDNINPGTYSSGTVLGGFVEQQNSAVCYIATTPSSVSATFYCSWQTFST